tara:strand:- start:53 stop:538 length:486 start_codon:yes stop_codon:yes gene_type:complete
MMPANNYTSTTPVSENAIIYHSGIEGYNFSPVKLDMIGNVKAPADVVAFFTSDKRLKDNLKKIKSPLRKILQIGGYTFNWNDKAPEWTKDKEYKSEAGLLKDVGVIAQDIVKVLPEAVHKRENGYLSVKYDKIVPLLIEGIKEQQTQIEELKKRINNLENK